MSMNVKLTVVQLDLFQSSSSTSDIETMLGPDGTALFIHQIRTFVENAFNSVQKHSQDDEYNDDKFQYNEFHSLGGDGYRISFQDVNYAYEFVDFFCKSVEEYNAKPNRKKLIFRIGAATGFVNFYPYKSGLDRIIGHTLVSVSRLSTAKPGWFYVDKATFDSFREDVKQKFQNTSVKGKGHEGAIIAWCCQMLANRHQEETEQKERFCIDWGNGITLEMEMEMVSIPSGSFLMGFPEDELNRTESASPQHLVNIKPFYIGKYPVTQAQWRAIAAASQVNRKLQPEPSHFKGDKRPVECVSWLDAVEFCDRLSKYTKKQYRLPSEAEWEYACRAGTTASFHFGLTITSELANYDASKTFADESKNKYREQTTEVGSFPPNTFGLCDMHGNVWEWCLDYWHDSYKGAPTDGSAWVNGGDADRRLLRGGSWVSYPSSCRSANRFKDFLSIRYNYIGFRVVCISA
jgi:formylglycine-generating enzyme required for sulfatase activity